LGGNKKATAHAHGGWSQKLLFAVGFAVFLLVVLEGVKADPRAEEAHGFTGIARKLFVDAVCLSHKRSLVFPDAVLTLFALSVFFSSRRLRYEHEDMNQNASL
jgi:hypothetical protein